MQAALRNGRPAGCYTRRDMDTGRRWAVPRACGVFQRRALSFSLPLSRSLARALGGHGRDSRRVRGLCGRTRLIGGRALLGVAGAGRGTPTTILRRQFAPPPTPSPPHRSTPPSPPAHRPIARRMRCPSSSVSSSRCRRRRCSARPPPPPWLPSRQPPTALDAPLQTPGG